MNALPQHLLCYLGCNAKTAGGILAICNNQISPVFVRKAGKLFKEKSPASLSDYIADKKKPHNLSFLLCKLHISALTNHRNLNLAGICKLLLHLFCNIAGYL